MERKTFLKAGLSVATAASIPGLSPSRPRVWAGEALKATTITWWNWGDPPLKRNVMASPGVSHNSPNDAVKVLYQRSHPGVIVDATTYPYPDYVTALKTSFAREHATPRRYHLQHDTLETVELAPGATLPLLLPPLSVALVEYGTA